MIAVMINNKKLLPVVTDLFIYLFIYLFIFVYFSVHHKIILPGTKGRKTKHHKYFLNEKISNKQELQ